MEAVIFPVRKFGIFILNNRIVYVFITFAVLFGIIFSSSCTTKDQTVSFTDPLLKAAMREAVKKPEGPIYVSDLKGLGYLWVIDQGISDLTGLEHCRNLYEVSMQSNQIIDISPLASCEQLLELRLQNNKIKDISPLASLKNLTTLLLGDNQIKDISALSSLTNLDSLGLGNNQITDISPLKFLNKLDILNLKNNQISDITPLETFPRLFFLHLDNNEIEDISPLANINSPKKMTLNNNRIRDIKPLADNADINLGVEIDLEGNPLSDTSINTYIPQLRARGVIVIWK